MAAYTAGKSRKTCQCGGEWCIHHRDPICADGNPTQAILQYTKCESCGVIDNSSIFIVFSEYIHETGEGWEIKIPAHDDAWQTRDGQEMNEKLFTNESELMTSREVEKMYQLKSGTARKTFHRGKIEGRIIGHTLFFKRDDVAKVWGHRLNEQ